METKYFLTEAYRYKASGNWEYKAVGIYNPRYDAKNAFHSRKAAITKASNDFAMVLLFDMYGNKVMSDYDNTYEAPEPNEE